MNKVPSSPNIFSPTHPNEDFWYKNPNPEFQWEISPDIIEISYGLDQNPLSSPKTISNKIENSKIFKETEDGIWYFHLKTKNKVGWSKTSHYKIKIDSTPPNEFDIIIDNQGDPTNPSPFLYFKTEDNLSGISHYEMKINQEDSFSLVLAETNPFVFPIRSPGSYQILVKALDNTGNFQRSSILLDIESIPIPKISISPKKYIAGTEVLYIAGNAPPDLTVIIFFKKDGKIIYNWETKSDKNGDWSFYTEELFKTGNYSISVASKDNRGAVSYSSPEQEIKIALSGISLGPFILTYQVLSQMLIILIILATGIIIYIIILKMKRIRKETEEAVRSLKRIFEEIKEKTIEKIEYLDSKPGLNQSEEKLRKELIEILEESEEIINKEIQDIKKELG